MISSELLNQIIAIIQKKPGKQDLKPEDLKEAIERAVIEVSRFCRIRILTEEFKYILADIASDICDMDTYNKLDQDNSIEGRVKTLKQGDTTVELNTKAAILPYTTMAELIKAHRANLLPYRSIYWR